MGPPKRLDTGLPNGVAGGFALTTWKGIPVLGFSSAAGGPSDTYTIEFPNGASGEITPAARWTESEVGGLDTSTFISPALIRYPSFDSLVIPAFVYRPPRRKLPSNGCFPVIIHPHGGPEGQHRPNFAPIVQYLVLELGVVVIDPNVRGSNGYGKTFVSLDNCEKREDSVKDVGALLDWIGQQPDLDADRVGIWGGSYGGYMVLAGCVHFGDRWRCGLSMVGISNIVTFLENVGVSSSLAPAEVRR